MEPVTIIIQCVQFIPLVSFRTRCLLYLVLGNYVTDNLGLVLIFRETTMPNWGWKIVFW